MLHAINQSRPQLRGTFLMHYHCSAETVLEKTPQVFGKKAKTHNYKTTGKMLLKIAQRTIGVGVGHLVKR